MKKQKDVFINIFIGISIILAFLPLLVTTNEFLTKIVESNFLYLWIEDYLVPLEAKMIGVIMMSLGYDFAFSQASSTVIVNGINLEITWNCLGWQSFLLFFISLMVGFKGKYKRMSVIEALGIGILGTFWINIIRMIITILLAVHSMSIFRIVFHDYLAAVTTLVWLLFYWWFSYSYVLVEKKATSVVEPA